MSLNRENVIGFMFVMLGAVRHIVLNKEVWRPGLLKGKLTMIRFKTFRNIVLGILIFAVGLGCFWQNANAQVVNVPDSNLEGAIREELGLSSELPITQQEMSKLFSLRAGAMQIENLTSIEYAQNLEDLVIRDNPIKDLTPIAGLKRLEHLNLSRIPIEDLTFLKDLTQLRQLHLFACQITDITPIQDLTKLVVLDLQANRITDLRPLANLTTLETLRLGHNYIVDISPLANLTQLTDLNLVDNQIKNVRALANLTRLETLWINGNLILDFSPIQGLSLTEFGHDEVCILPDLPIRERIENRSLPSIIQAWDDGIALMGDMPALSHLSGDDIRAYHDIIWHGGANLFGLDFLKAPPWSELGGPIEAAIARRDELLAKNPNMLFLAHLLSSYSKVGNLFPEEWSGWLRDETGNIVVRNPTNSTYYIDLSKPEVQDIFVQQAVSVAKCGLYDGILYDSWREHMWGESLVSILKRIRENVPDDFLIICNRNHYQLPLSVPYINGSFMETFYDYATVGYTTERIAVIEDTLLWFEQNAREPQINCLRGQGIPSEPPDSPTNKRWMRLFTTMSLTLSDGYVVYTTGRWFQEHIWYPFWDADLGQPIGPTAQRYQEDIEGLYIREFTNGWAVYNRSGKPQEISLSALGTPVSDRESTAASLTHLLPDLDGEIYLKTKHPADVNGDWVVNVLDLVQVANSLGKSAPDLNGDGVVNVLDLVFVSKHFASKNED